MTYMASEKVKEELEDLHDGLHLAMENLIKNKNYPEAERILRIVDANMATLLSRL